jgi:hypothetical protein
MTLGAPHPISAGPPGRHWKQGPMMHQTAKHIEDYAIIGNLQTWLRIQATPLCQIRAQLCVQQRRK